MYFKAKQFFLTSQLPPFLSYYPSPAPLSIVFPPFSLFPCFLPSLSLVVAFCMLPSSVIVCPMCPCSEARELELFIFHCSLFSLSSLLLSSVSELLLLLSFFLSIHLFPSFSQTLFSGRLHFFHFVTFIFSFVASHPKNEMDKMNPESRLIVVLALIALVRVLFQFLSLFSCYLFLFSLSLC